jgi:oligosaccharide repeat unit polymerase
MPHIRWQALAHRAIETDISVAFVSLSSQSCLMIYISLLFVLSLHFVLFARRGLIDPISVFFLAFLYYSYLAPIVMLNFNIFSVDFAGTESWVTLETINKSAILFAVGYAGFALSYYFFTGQAQGVRFVSQNIGFGTLFADPYLRTMIGFSIIIIVVLSTVFRDALIVSTGSYEGKISGNYSNSVFSFLLSVALTLFSLILNFIVLNVRRFVLVTTVGIGLCLVLTLLTFSKQPLIFAALCVFCALHRFGRVPYPILLSGLIIGALVITVLFMPMFSLFRATGNLDYAGVNVDTISLMIAEASSPFSIVHFSFSGYISPEGNALWQSFVLWLPRAIWADRPLDMAEGFAQQAIVGWQAGFGLGFSPFAEAYVRAGLYGSFVFMALVGAVLAGLQRGFAMFIPMQFRVPTSLTIGGIVSVLFLRGLFSGLITQSIQNWVPIIIMSLIAAQLVKTFGYR